MRRHPPHHLSPARANHPAGQDPGARLSLPSHHSNAPIKPESQSILSKIIALWFIGLRGKARAGLLVNEKTFRQAADQFLKEY